MIAKDLTKTYDMIALDSSYYPSTSKVLKKLNILERKLLKREDLISPEDVDYAMKKLVEEIRETAQDILNIPLSLYAHSSNPRLKNGWSELLKEADTYYEMMEHYGFMCTRQRIIIHNPDTLATYQKGTLDIALGHINPDEQIIAHYLHPALTVKFYDSAFKTAEEYKNLKNFFSL